MRNLIFIIIILTSCLNMPKKNIKQSVKQDENFQKCQVLKVINECYVLIQVDNKVYVSKLAGLSFDTKDCHPSWSKEQIRQLKVCLLDDTLNWRSDNYYLYLLDISPKKDISEILLIGKDLNGYYNFNRLIVNLGGTIDNQYKGPYSESLMESFLETKNSKFGLFDEIDKEWLGRVTPKGFVLDNFLEGVPSIVGEWKPNEKEQEFLKLNGYDNKIFFK